MGKVRQTIFTAAFQLTLQYSLPHFSVLVSELSLSVFQINAVLLRGRQPPYSFCHPHRKRTFKNLADFTPSPNAAFTYLEAIGSPRILNHNTTF